MSSSPTFCHGSLEVLTYDHRGVGKSASGAADRKAGQTSELLAADVAALLAHVWPPASAPPGARLHVYGASMGGFVAQRLALMPFHSGEYSSE
jgi:alpha-beta hydrolase superfamily lysophospholipase